MTQLQALLSQIENKTMLLPEFQRGYVWNRDQVRGLLRSLYLGYPVGSLLVWETQVTEEDVRGTSVPVGNRTLILDGQQRLTSLYGVARGTPPEFFEGDAKSFTGLFFNVASEVFEFYAPSKMKGDPTWVSVTRIFQEGLEPFIDELSGETDVARRLARLAQLQHVLQRDFHLETITGDDMSTDVVVDIFNRVNSGGTKLSKGDLALAKIAAQAPEARGEMRIEIERWKGAGYNFTLDWLLRNVNAVATGRALFSYLDDVSIADFQSALKKTVGYVDHILNLLAGRLGLDHDRVLMGRYAIPVLSKYLHMNGGSFPTKEERDKALYWYIHAGLWGRFAGSTESTLGQDYETLQKRGLDGLITSLAQSRGGGLKVNPVDFTGMGMGSRFYPMLYLLTRVGEAQDLCSGSPLKHEMLGALSSLQVHHIFPKKVLYDAGYTRSEVNAVGNFCFLTQSCNLTIGKREPTEYLGETVEKGFVEAVQSQWIPQDQTLWEVDRYRDFLDARRELLAYAANTFLDQLVKGSIADEMLPRLQQVDEDSEDSDSQAVKEMMAILKESGITQPLIQQEVIDDEKGVVLAIADALWGEGLQPGRGERVALILGTSGADIERMQATGYKVFTSCEALISFVEREAGVDSGASEA